MTNIKYKNVEYDYQHKTNANPCLENALTRKI